MLLVSSPAKKIREFIVMSLSLLVKICQRETVILYSVICKRMRSTEAFEWSVTVPDETG